MDLDYPNHPKTTRLIALIGDTADAYPVRMWAYLGKFHAKDGTFAGYSIPEIEGVLRWRGDSGALVAALVKVQFLDETPAGYQAHDWNEHEAHIFVFKERGKANANKRWGNASSIANGIAGGNAPALPYLEVPILEAEPSASGEPEAVLEFPIVGKTQKLLGAGGWSLTKTKLIEYQESFPGVDVLAECKKALQWTRDNPANRKTKSGMPAFLCRWLSKVQDRGGSRPLNGAAVGRPGPTPTKIPTAKEVAARQERS